MTSPPSDSRIALSFLGHLQEACEWCMSNYPPKAQQTFQPAAVALQRPVTRLPRSKCHHPVSLLFNGVRNNYRETGQITKLSPCCTHLLERCEVRWQSRSSSALDPYSSRKKVVTFGIYVWCSKPRLVLHHDISVATQLESLRVATWDRTRRR